MNILSQTDTQTGRKKHDWKWCIIHIQTNSACRIICLIRGVNIKKKNNQYDYK